MVTQAELRVPGCTAAKKTVGDFLSVRAQFARLTVRGNYSQGAALF